ncbi:hypothetical protein [Sulfurimicrobium lacus]|uniref:hypothetical protein n=1 Tax=Sulfurimicrobium lacus TaxID=2715678 RepID=UPI0015668FA2|nr:hypothetical protein [Sulfurimicrobium lacus]
MSTPARGVPAESGGKAARTGEKARDEGRSRVYDAEECNAAQARFRCNPEGRGFAGARQEVRRAVQSFCTSASRRRMAPAKPRRDRV